MQISGETWTKRQTVETKQILYRRISKFYHFLGGVAMGRSIYVGTGTVGRSLP